MKAKVKKGNVLRRPTGKLLRGELKEIVDWINKAGSREERASRKARMFGQLYGSSVMTPIKTEGGQVPFDPDQFLVKDGAAKEHQPSNPKSLMGLRKVPNLSVIPPTSLIYQGLAMQYGAFIAKRTDGTRGYGPYNWRDQPVEAGTYVDAAIRHLMCFFDGEEFEIIYDDAGEEIARVPHLGAAIATIGILADAMEHGLMIDNRPKNRNRAATRLLAEFTRKEALTKASPR